LACIQATWFCLSCIMRTSEKLPTSMLELNTFADALCTVVVYILWWRKPLDINRPLIIQDARLKPLLAYMWMSSKTSYIGKPKYNTHHHSIVGQDPEFEALIDTRVFTGAADMNAPAITAIRHAQDAAHRRSASNGQPGGNLIAELPDGGTVVITPTQIHPRGGFRVNEQSTRWKVESIHFSGDKYDRRSDRSVSYKPAVFKLTHNDSRRWELARTAMDKYRLRKPGKNLDLVTIKPVAEYMLPSDSNEESEFWTYFGLSFATVFYGGVHALAWNAQFPSHLEQVLWRVSALVMASPAALFMFYMLFLRFLRCAAILIRFCHGKLALKTISKQESALKNLPVEAKPSSKGCICFKRIIALVFQILEALGWGVAINAMLFLYFTARGYLVYESFKTLFFLPAEAYMATSWPQYLPHIT
jgi:hypothetical protein